MEVVCSGKGLTPQKIRRSALFRKWTAQFGREWEIHSVYVNVAFAWKGDVRMICATVTCTLPDGRNKTELVYMRGGTVNILPIIVGPDGTEYVVFVEQPRVPVGQVCVSLPSGMVDNGTTRSTALLELAEEVGGGINWGEPQSLNRAVLGSDAPMLVSPGNTDEEVTFFVVRTHLTKRQIQELRGSMAGAANEGEQTRVHVVVLLTEALGYIARGGARPSLKTMTSLLLYQQARQLRRG